jgi:hypothetical protein
MITMLAIEQLTGYAKPTVVVIGGGSSAGAADALAKTQSQIEDAKTKQASLQKTADDATAADDGAQKKVTAALADLNKAKTAGGDTTTPQATYDAAVKSAGVTAKAKSDAAAALTQQIGISNSLDTLLKSQEKDINLSSGSATPLVVQPANGGAPDPSAVLSTAKAVEILQANSINQSFVADRCMDLVFPDPQDDNKQQSQDAPKSAGGGVFSQQDYVEAQRQYFAKEETQHEVLQFCLQHLKEMDDFKEAQLNRAYGCDNDGKNCKFLESYYQDPTGKPTGGSSKSGSSGKKASDTLTTPNGTEVPAIVPLGPQTAPATAPQEAPAAPVVPESLTPSPPPS